MLVVPNASSEKARFRRMFINVGDVYVTIEPDSSRSATIKITSERRCFTVHCTGSMSYPACIFLSNVSINDCVFDLLFDKEGFFIEAYPVAYKDLRTISKSGVEGWISEVIIKTKRKTTHFMSACNEYCQMIQKVENL